MAEEKRMQRVLDAQIRKYGDDAMRVDPVRGHTAVCPRTLPFNTARRLEYWAIQYCPALGNTSTI